MSLISVLFSYSYTLRNLCLRTKQKQWVSLIAPAPFWPWEWICGRVLAVCDTLKPFQALRHAWSQPHSLTLSITAAAAPQWLNTCSIGVISWHTVTHVKIRIGISQQTNNFRAVSQVYCILWWFLMQEKSLARSQGRRVFSAQAKKVCQY